MSATNDDHFHSVTLPVAHVPTNSPAFYPAIQSPPAKAPGRNTGSHLLLACCVPSTTESIASNTCDVPMGRYPHYPSFKDGEMEALRGLT